MNKAAALIIITGFMMMISCRKKHDRKLSAEKEIQSFAVITGDSEYKEGTIRNDSILVWIAHNARRDSLQTKLKYTGVSIFPLPSKTIDYTHPVVFTVTAEDGSTQRYTVVVSNFTSLKEITGFTFKASDNAGLATDVIATIDSNYISAMLTSDADITRLKPSIIFKGESISPVNGAAMDFTNGATYRVTADDGTTRDYTVMVTNNNLVYIGSVNGNLYALSCATGKVTWKYNTGSLVSHPIYKDGLVYVGSSDGTFYALDGATGALRWKFFDRKINYTAPHVAAGTVYVGFYTNNLQGGTYAINAATGNLIWKVYFPGVGGGLVASPTYAEGLVYVPVFDGGLFALDAASGVTKWQYNCGITQSNPAVVNGTVYICSEAKALSAFDSRTGALKWTNSEFINVVCAPAVSNGVVYVGGTSMCAINANDGSLIWKTKVTEVGPAEGVGAQITTGSFSSPVISGGLLFVGNSDCNTFAFDLATGAVKWSYNNNGGTRKNSLPGPVAAHGMLITDRGDNMLKAFYAATGKLIWTFTADGLINTYPCIVDTKGNAFYCGASGNVN